MVNYLKSFLSCTVLIVLFWSCGSKQSWYVKNLSPEEKKDYAERLLGGAGFYYQGTAAEQTLLFEATELDPSNASIWRELGAAPVKRGFGKEMNQYYSAAVKRDPISYQGIRGYMYLYFYRDYHRAIADFDATDTLTLETDYPQGQSVDYMRGIAYLGLNDLKQAEFYFNKYIQEIIVNEGGEEWVDVYAFLYRGITYKLDGNDEAARADFQRCLKYYENLSDAYYHLAEIELNQKNYQQAKNFITACKQKFDEGYYHQRPYVTVLFQLHRDLIEELSGKIS